MRNRLITLLSVATFALSPASWAQSVEHAGDPARYALPGVETPRWPIPSEDFVMPIGGEDNPVVARPGSEEARIEVDGYINTCLNQGLPLAQRVAVCEDAVRYNRGVHSVSARTWQESARTYIAVGDIRRARYAYERGIWDWNHEDEPTDPLPLVAAASRPELAEAHCEFAHFLWRDNQLGRAKSEALRALQYNPQNRCAADRDALMRGAPSPQGPLPAQVDYTAPPANALNIVRLAARCRQERGTAIRALFGDSATQEQGLLMDHGLTRSSLSSTDVAALARSYRDSAEITTGDPAANDYMRCLLGERLRHLQPDIDLAAVQSDEYPQEQEQDAAPSDRFANLPRRGDGATAGVGMLRNSADPGQRAALANARNDQIAQRNTRMAQRNADNAAFWQGLMEFTASALVIASDYYAAQAQTAPGATSANSTSSCRTGAVGANRDSQECAGSAQ